MSTIDAIECTEVPHTGLNLVKVKDKAYMKAISKMIQKPILRCGKEYFILDVGVCYYHFSMVKRP